MRVLTIGNLYPPASQGGYERIWVGAVATLRAAGHDVRVLTTEPTPGALPPGGFPAEEPGIARRLQWYWHDYEWRELDEREALALERANAAVLADELATFRPDLVSWWAMGGMSLSLLEQIRRAGVPAVGLVADDWMTYGWQADRWMARFRSRRGRALARVRERLAGVPTRVDLARAADWLFISRTVLDRAPVELPGAQLAHPGVDPERFPFVAPAAEWGWRLLYVGRVEPVKGVAHAIEALAELPEAATLTIDGPADDKHRAELEALAGRLGVTGRITWQRSAPEAVGALYAAHDVTLFPVVWDEPWGLVPLESMSVGRPVVATGTGGTAEYLEDGVCGLVVGRGQASELAAAVRRRAADPDLRARLVEGGRATAARFTEAAFHAEVLAAHERAGRALAARAPG